MATYILILESNGRKHRCQDRSPVLRVRTSVKRGGGKGVKIEGYEDSF